MELLDVWGSWWTYKVWDKWVDLWSYLWGFGRAIDISYVFKNLSLCMYNIKCNLNPQAQAHSAA